MMESGNSTDKQTSGEKALAKFAETLISRMEALRDQKWQKEWITPGAPVGLPQNISGRSYNGTNAFMLLLNGTDMGYKTHVYMTFNQVKEANARVLKGEKSYPVAFYDFIVKDKEGNRITYAEYKNLTDMEKEQYTVRPFLKSYPVFNIDQTNYKEMHPEKYQKLVDKFKPSGLKDDKGMYANAEIDRLISKQQWICPIRADNIEKGAYYSPSKNIVVVPLKAQFNLGTTPDEIYVNGMSYYSTLLHEITHSTIKPLNRESGKVFGDPKYAKEELVAEFTAALVGGTLGFNSKITDNSAKYLNSWISAIKKEPKFLMSVLADVNKASALIFSHIDKQRVALEKEPVLVTSLPIAPAQLKPSEPTAQKSLNIETLMKASEPNNNKVSFQDLKARVGIEEVAYSLGYRLDKRAGVGKYFEMVLNQGADKHDTLIIRNTSDKASQTYFRRDGSKGDVISLIRENLNSFNISGRNEWDTIAKVLAKFANMPITENKEELQHINSNRGAKPFDPQRYEIKQIEPGNVHNLFKTRGLDDATVMSFAPFIHLVSDRNNPNFRGFNIAFPYTSESPDKVEGYEIRGFGGFKSKAAGTNSNSAAWVADFSNGNSAMVKNVYFFESAFDAMAFYQVNRIKLEPFLNSTAFVSLGGTFSDNQIYGVINRFPNARLVDCFDNDIAGRVNCIRMLAVAENQPVGILKTDESTLSVKYKGMNFSVDISSSKPVLGQINDKCGVEANIAHHTAPVKYKDWNDCLLGKTLDTSIEVSKHDRNKNLEQRRKSGLKV